MAGTEFSVGHITTRSKLPSDLVVGRAYFIDDEGAILIKHGTETITYGSKIYWTGEES